MDTRRAKRLQSRLRGRHRLSGVHFKPQIDNFNISSLPISRKALLNHSFNGNKTPIIKTRNRNNIYRSDDDEVNTAIFEDSSYRTPDRRSNSNSSFQIQSLIIDPIENPTPNDIINSPTPNNIDIDYPQQNISNNNENSYYDNMNDVVTPHSERDINMSQHLLSPIQTLQHTPKNNIDISGDGNDIDPFSNIEFENDFTVFQNMTINQLCSPVATITLLHIFKNLFMNIINTQMLPKAKMDFNKPGNTPVDKMYYKLDVKIFNNIIKYLERDFNDILDLNISNNKMCSQIRQILQTRKILNLELLKINNEVQEFKVMKQPNESTSGKLFEINSKINAFNEKLRENNNNTPSSASEYEMSDDSNASDDNNNPSDTNEVV